MYQQILNELSPQNKIKLTNKLKTHSDPLNIYSYIDCIISNSTNLPKISQSEINKIDKKCTPKSIRGGAATIHPDLYATNNYTENPANQVEMKINFENNIARPQLLIGGCECKELYEQVKKYLNKHIKNKKSLKKSLNCIITQRLLSYIKLVNKNNRLTPLYKK